MKRSTLLALPLICLTAAALAHSGATGVVKERMDRMKGIALLMKDLGAMFKGEKPYKAGAVSALSRELMRLGGEAMTYFPKGSTQHPSEATAEIWTDWPRFEAQANAMQDAAQALADAAANPRGTGAATAPEALFRDLAETCKTCHQDFRVKK